MERATPVKGITLEDIECKSAKSVYSFRGYPTEPIRNLVLRDIRVGKVKEPSTTAYVDGFVCEEVAK